MALDPAIIRAVEQLDHRVTVSDVAVQNVIGEGNLVYTTGTDLLEQDSKAVESLSAV